MRAVNFSVNISPEIRSRGQRLDEGRRGARKLKRSQSCAFRSEEMQYVSERSQYTLLCSARAVYVRSTRV